MECVLTDTATIYYRAYYSLPESLVAPDGFPNNAVRGTLTTLRNLVERFQTTHIVPTWDADWRPQWRVDLVPSYKTHRLEEPAQGSPVTESEAVPDTLGPQIGAIANILTCLGIPPLGAPDYEADDVIGTLTHSTTASTIIVSSDRDLIQCVNDARSVRYLLMAPGGMDRWGLLDEAAVHSRFGIPAERYVDYAVLRGDPSDGLPGVPGVGEKTAAALVNAFGSLDAVVDAATILPPPKPMTPRIAANVDPEALWAAHQVTMTATDVPCTMPKPWQPKFVDRDGLSALSAEWGVQSSVDALIESLHRVHDATAEEADRIARA